MWWSSCEGFGKALHERCFRNRVMVTLSVTPTCTVEWRVPAGKCMCVRAYSDHTPRDSDSNVIKLRIGYLWGSVGFEDALAVTPSHWISDVGWRGTSESVRPPRPERASRISDPVTSPACAHLRKRETDRYDLC